jgi:adenylyltransferase/sulfurtransferase
LLSLDVWTSRVTSIATGSPRAECPACGRRIFRYLAGEGRPEITLCGRNSVQIHERHRPLDLVALGARLAPLGAVKSNRFMLQFTPSGAAQESSTNLTLFPDGRAIIQGTSDPGVARSLYARYVGN